MQINIANKVAKVASVAAWSMCSDQLVCKAFIWNHDRYSTEASFCNLSDFFRDSCQCKECSPVCDIKQLCMYFICWGYYEKDWPQCVYLPLIPLMQGMSLKGLQSLYSSDRMYIAKILLEGEAKLNWYFPII